MEILLALVVAAFVVLNGVNDGGAILALGLKIPALRLGSALLLLAAGVVAAPLLTTAVATTLAQRLVTFEGDAGRAALLVAVLAAVLVVAVLGRLGLPTSLTLAIVGAITGAGWGSGLPTSWAVTAAVLVLAALGPLVGAVVAFGLSHLRARIPAPGGAHVVIRRLHRVAFGLQCVAYGANDGQKMLAVVAVASGPLVTTGAPPLGVLLGIGALFLLGMVLGVRRISRTISNGLLPLRPPHAVIAELSAGSAVLATGALGAPVSMTQALAGGLIGAGVSESYRRVRWKQALHILMAWILTLPTALLLAAGASAAVRFAAG